MARVRRILRRTVLAGMLAAAVPTPAVAQPAPPRFELSVGGLWNGGYALGAASATETRNQGSGPFVLFDTDSDVVAGGGLEARFGVRLGPVVSVEAGGSWTRASIATRVSGDYEGAPGVEARSDFTQYVVDGAVVVRLTRLTMAGGRAVPFLQTGAGYLRQLHEGGVLVETGTVYHGGGGLFLRLRSGSGWLKQLGARVDARLYARSGGIDFVDDRRRTYAALSAGVTVGF